MIDTQLPSVNTSTQYAKPSVGLDATISSLWLYKVQVDVTQTGQEVGELLEASPLLPGILLVQNNKYVGMISKAVFWEHLSRPFGRSLFIKRPIASLYEIITEKENLIVMDADTQVMVAAKQALMREPKTRYEPIVVKLSDDDYRLLDVHQLLIAQSDIHELATQVIRQQTQDQLMQTEKMAMLGQMVAGIAHEIRNPVNAILGNLKYLSSYYNALIQLNDAYAKVIGDDPESIIELKDDLELEFLLEDLPKLLQSVELASDRISELVNGLRTFSHMGGNLRRSTNLHECLNNTLLIMKNRLKIGVDVIRNYGDIPHVECYSGQISQVFMNLISNALDALDEKRDKQKEQGLTPDQPRITITTSCDDNKEVIIKISDNAGGISPEVQARIFEMFFTTKNAEKGTGMGLAISHQIVTEKHNGRITVNSKLGEGTEFSVILPVCAESSENAA